MAKYKLQADGVIDQEKGYKIPADEGNRHWRGYQNWLAQGFTPDPEFTQEELDVKAAAAMLHQLEADLVHTDRMLLKLVTRLCSVLIANGTLTKTDIGAAYVDGALALKAKLDDLEANA